MPPPALARSADGGRRLRSAIVHPYGVTCSATISACEKSKQPAQAWEMFQVLRQQGVVPDVVTHNALVIKCGKGKQPAQA